MEGLILNNQNLVVGGREAVALDIVEVDVGGLEARRQIAGREAARGRRVLDRHVRAGDDDAALEALELDVDLHTVELQRGEGEGLTRVLREPEGKGHVQNSALTRVANELRAGPALTNHLGETAARLAGELLPHEEEVVVERVDGGATDDDARAADEKLADIVGPVGPDAAKLGAMAVGAVLVFFAALEARALAVLVAQPAILGRLELKLLLALRRLGEAVRDVVGDGSLVVLRAGRARLVHVNGELVARRNARALLLRKVARSDAGKIDDDIHVIDEITVAVEGDLSLRTECNGSVERLANRFHCEIGVLVVAHLPEGECRILRQIGVECTLSDELGKSARTT